MSLGSEARFECAVADMLEEEKRKEALRAFSRDLEAIAMQQGPDTQSQRRRKKRGPMKLKITGLKYGNIEQIRDCLVLGNHVKLDCVMNEYGTKGVAWDAICKGVKVGVLAEGNTLRGYESFKEENATFANGSDLVWERVPEVIDCRVSDLNMDGSKNPWLVAEVIPKKKGG